MRKFYYVFLLFVLPLAASAQDQVVASGNWNSPAIWSAGVVNDVNTDVQINNGFTVQLVGGDNFSSGNITTGMNNTLTVPTGATLTVGNSTNSRSVTAGTNMTITANSGTIIIWGDLNVNASLIMSIQTGGSIIIKGNVNLADGASITVNGDLEIDGAFTAGMNTNVTVNGNVSVYGLTTVGAGSNVIGTGTFHAYGGCSGPSTFCGTAPLTLVSFKAEARTSTIAVSWTTASEINFDYFILEKSSDGQHFSEVTTVAGKGSARGRADYAVEDEKPLNGRSYYRLTEVDLDRSVNHLRAVTVNFSGERTLSVFPNPVTNGQVNFQLNFVPTSSVQVSIIDLRGITMSTFEINEQGVLLPVQLTSGVYLVTMRSENMKEVSKLVVK